MIIKCNSCEKEFSVPDGAIKAEGRLVQCGSCGNKWTQFPIKEKKILNELKPKIKKTKSRAKKNKLTPYSTDYLKKKYNLNINPSESLSKNDRKTREKNSLKIAKQNFGFYSSLIFLSVFFLTLFGVLNLTKEIIILYYPNLEIYINYLYESFGYIKLIVTDILTSY
ncbi:MAG: zinc-ribbon domain-containing protein [Pelagibacterales bacterium]|jgi:predicted Zn finger-like uncharacterized protein|nr:zinc-ribbon domain-containing protein [Pelagibacterales bacterium]